MATITKQYDIAATTTVEFESKVYFRIEILRVHTGAPVEITSFEAEVYLLRLPHGSMVMGDNPNNEDRTFRQFWLYLDDFPKLEGSSVDGLRDQVIERLSAYADEYLARHNTKLKRI